MRRGQPRKAPGRLAKETHEIITMDLTTYKESSCKHYMQGQLDVVSANDGESREHDLRDFIMAMKTRLKRHGSLLKNAWRPHLENGSQFF